MTTTTTITPKSKGRSLRGILKNKEQTVEVPTSTIYQDFNEFNDGKEWYMDFYKLFWDEEIDENLY